MYRFRPEAKKEHPAVDLGSVSTGLAQSAAASQVNVSVLRSLENLQSTLAGELFGSIGMGRSIDAFA